MNVIKKEAYENGHKEIPGNPSTAKSSTLHFNTRPNKEPLRILTEKEWDFWIEKGYVVIKQAISRQEALDTASFLWEFEEKDPNNSETWYSAARAEMKMKELA